MYIRAYKYIHIHIHICIWLEMPLFRKSPTAAEDELVSLFLQVEYDQRPVIGKSDRLEQLNRKILKLLDSFPEAVFGSRLNDSNRPFAAFFSSCRNMEDESRGLKTLTKMLQCYHDENAINSWNRAVFNNKDYEIQPVQLLHLACQYRHLPVDYIRAIVSFDPKAVMATKCSNGAGRGTFPLAIALNQPSPNRETTQYLFRLYPGAANSSNIEDIANVNDITLMQEMFAIKPDLIIKDGPYGSVLHRICVHPEPPSLEVLQWVIETEPSLLRCRNSSSCLPMHLVRNLEAAKALIRAYPKALEVVDAGNSLPLHTIAYCASGQKGATASIQYVAGKYPKALLHRNDLQETPLDVVERCSYGKQKDGMVKVLRGIKEEQVHLVKPTETSSMVSEFERQQKRIHGLERKLEGLESALRATQSELEGSRLENESLRNHVRELESFQGD